MTDLEARIRDAVADHVRAWRDRIDAVCLESLAGGHGVLVDEVARTVEVHERVPYGASGKPADWA